MSNSKVSPIRRPTRLPAGLDYVVAELCHALEGMPEQMRRHGVTAAERDELQAKTEALVAAYRRHLPQREE